MPYELSVKWAPDYYQWVPDGLLYDNRDLGYIAKALNDEFVIFRDRVEAWRKNNYPRECDTPGIKEFEDWLDLSGSAAQDLQQRIDAVVALLNKKLPYTWITLHRMMAAIVGWDNFSLHRTGAKITVRIDQSRYASWAVVWDLFEEVIPMNLWWDMRNAVTTEDAEVEVAPGVRLNATVDSPMPEGIHTHEHVYAAAYGVGTIRQRTGEPFRDVEPHYTNQTAYVSSGSVITRTIRTVTEV